MSTFTQTLSRPTLADRLITRSLATDIVLVVAGAGLTAVAAQIAIPLWPVPITMQTLAVLLVGSALGAARGSLSMLLYLALGVIGLPVFSDASSGWAVLAGPTGGYLFGFVVSAALTGWLAQRNWDKKYLGAALSFLAGTVVTFVFGMLWLSYALSLDLNATLQAGLYPFIVGGIIKAGLAAAIIPSTWKLAERLHKRDDS